MARPLTIFLQTAGWPARYQATTLAVTAAASGDAVLLALFFDPLRAWVDGRVDEGAPTVEVAGSLPALTAMLGEVRGALSLRVVACDTAIAHAEIDADV